MNKQLSRCGILWLVTNDVAAHLDTVLHQPTLKKTLLAPGDQANVRQ